MAEIPIRQAKSLCSASEYELVHWSTKKRVEDLTPARLIAKRDRARKLRDKFRDLANQQKREIRGKSDARRSRPATDNRNTRVKEQLFAETVQRFEAALAEKNAALAAAESSGSAAGSIGGKKVSKKVGKKVAKKTGKKVGKKVGKKLSGKSEMSAADLMKKAGARKPAAAKANSRKKAAAKRAKSVSVVGGQKRTRSEAAEGLQATIAEQTAFRAMSEIATPKAKQKMLNRGGNPRIFGSVSSNTRRSQAKRDSR